MSNLTNNLSDSTKVSQRRLLMISGIVLGMIFIAIGIVYLTTMAGNLPSFVPGHIDGGTIYRTKHGIGAIILGVGAFVLAWFSSSPASSKKK